MQPTVIALCLFLATCGSTFLAGMGILDRRYNYELRDFLWAGFSYSAPMMLILLCHEMGHYLTARWHRVPASLPFFLPMPLISPLGTLGAVIVQSRGFGTRRMLFDIAIAGPLAGIVIAIPVAWFGVQQAKLMEIDPRGMWFGDPLLLKAMIWTKFGVLPANHDVEINPLLLAGWAGIFLTGFNLVPIGQLDGGHIIYGLLGKHAHRISYAVLALGIAFMAYFNNWSFALMVLLLILTGIKHPPTINDHEPLGRGRTILGWATMSLFFICFTPFPLNDPPPRQADPSTPIVEPTGGDGVVRGRIPQVSEPSPIAISMNSAEQL